MPSTIIYKPGFPTAATPLETSASVGSDGLVTGSAVFLVSAGATEYPINSRISQSLFSSLQGVRLQGLFVESRSLEHRNGIYYLNIGVVGAINPPVFETRRDVSPRSFNKSGTIIVENQSATATFSFDYLAETITVSTIIVGNLETNISVPNPDLLQVWNQRGRGLILSWSPNTGTYAPPNTFGSRILAYPRVLTTQTSEQRSNVVRISKSAQLVYE